MVFVGDDLGGTVVVQLLLQGEFLLLRGPVVADEGVVLFAHHVQSLVEGLLLGDEHLEDEDSRRLGTRFIIASIDFVEVEELLAQLLFCTLIHVLRIFNLL